MKIAFCNILSIPVKVKVNRAMSHLERRRGAYLPFVAVELIGG